ncbi:putative reverse transcriptase domain-containing protein [Tanacetum coccineum]
MFSLVWIMPPRMRTQSASQPIAESRGGDRVNGLVEVEGVEDLGKICMLIREVAVSMSWNDFKFMMIEEFCPSYEMQKLETELWNHAMVEAGHAAYTDRFHALARLVPHLISGALTDEAVRNGSIKKVEKRGNVGEPSKDKNGRDDNKRTGTGNAFATTTNPVGRENTGTWTKCTTCNSYHALGGPCRTCFNCNRPGHLAKDCRGVPRNVNPVNARNLTVRACYECGSTDHVRLACPRLNMAQGPRGNHLNQVAANNGGQGRGNQGNQARGIEPSELGFKYEIKIASGQLVEIDKVGDYVLLKVSPWKGVVHFGKKGKLAPRFVGPFEIIEKVGSMAYRLDLHEELNGVHDMLIPLEWILKSLACVRFSYA